MQEKPKAISLLTDISVPLDDALKAFEKRTRRWKPVNRDFTLMFGLRLRQVAEARALGAEPR
jgi:hypothetical protein